MRKLWNAINLAAHWRAIDEDTRREPGWKPGFDWRVLVILVFACVTLTLQEYIGDRNYFEELYPYDRRNPDMYWHLKGFAWWSGWRFLGYLLLPMLVVLCMPGERLRDYHISPRGFIKHLWIYAIMFALILPAVFLASRTHAFRSTYPFYQWANRSLFDLWAWEAMYAVQFLSLEFFFRGFILQGLRRAMGANAILVMIVPYCMIHYGKPMAETFGAIGAGIILGTLAMRTRSIWGGVAIHVGVAWTMDLLAVSQCPASDSGRPCPVH
jgi:membrane protease YdiL (CAAX protease family)